MPATLLNTSPPSRMSYMQPADLLTVTPNSPVFTVGAAITTTFPLLMNFARGLVKEASENGPTILMLGWSFTILAAHSLTRRGGMVLFGALVVGFGAFVV